MTEKESWTVLLLKNVQTEKGKLRYLQVYTERSEKDYLAEKRDSRAADHPQQPEQNGCRIGEVVRVWGEFTPFQTASNPGEFDYAAYYRGQKLVWRVFARTVQRIDENGLRILYAPANMIRYFRASGSRAFEASGRRDGWQYLCGHASRRSNRHAGRNPGTLSEKWDCPSSGSERPASVAGEYGGLRSSAKSRSRIWQSCCCRQPDPDDLQCSDRSFSL